MKAGHYLHPLGILLPFPLSPQAWHVIDIANLLVNEYMEYQWLEGHIHM